MQQDIAAELAGALLLMPTTAIDAPPLARLEQDQDYFFACNQQILRNTMATSFLDMPSLSLPTGLNRNGLPAALMVSAPVGHEETVLAAGRGSPACSPAISRSMHSVFKLLNACLKK